MLFENVHEWNNVEIFSLPQVIENSRQYLLLRTDILQKIVAGCPLILVYSFSFWYWPAVKAVSPISLKLT